MQCKPHRPAALSSVHQIKSKIQTNRLEMTRVKPMSVFQRGMLCIYGRVAHALWGCGVLGLRPGFGCQAPEAGDGCQP